MSFRTSPYAWYNPLGYTYSGVTLDNYQALDPYSGDPLGFGGTGMFACSDPCDWTWPPEDREGGIDWWGILEGAWEFFNEVVRPALQDDDEEERRRRQVQLAQSGAVTSGWFILLVVGAIVAAVVFTDGGS